MARTPGDGADLDPRFDPRFQRGGAGLRSGAPSETPASRRSRASEPPTVREPTVPTQEFPTAGQLADTPETAAAAGSGAAEVDAAGADEWDEPRRLNPWRLALLLVSLACIVGSGVAVQWNVDHVTDYYSQFTADLTVYQFVAFLPAPLLTAGLLGLIAWIVVGALARGIRWQS